MAVFMMQLLLLAPSLPSSSVSQAGRYPDLIWKALLARLDV